MVYWLSNIAATIIVVITIAILLGMIFGPSKPRTATDRQTVYCAYTSKAKAAAKSVTEDFITRDLKSPSTAKFIDMEATYATGCNFRVTGKVDSQNSFGAMLRSRFWIDLEYRPETDDWRRKDYEIIPQ